MNILNLLDALSRDKPAVDPVVALVGEEGFLIDQAVARLKALVLEGDEAGFESLRGGETTPAAIVDLVRTVPLFSRSRLVLVRDADKLKLAKAEPLLAYLEAPARASCLVLTALEIQAKTKLWTLLQKKQWLHKADPLRDIELGPYVRTMAARRNAKIEPEASAMLVSFVGSDLKLLDDAVERLSLYTAGKRAISVQDVLEAVDDQRMRSVFDLTDAVGRRDAASAIGILRRLLRQQEDESPIKINHMLARQVRQLLWCRTSMEKDPERLAASLGVPRFVARKLSDQCRRFSVRELERAVRLTAKTDLDLKSSRLAPEILLDRAVLDLCLQ